MLILAAITAGTFAFSIVMWATGTTSLQAAAAQRLAGALCIVAGVVSLALSG